MNRDSFTPQSSPDKFLTTGQVAERCGVNFRTVIRWIQKGYLRAYRLPGNRADHRIPIEEFERFVSAQGMAIPTSRARRILIVDDDPVMSRAIQRQLMRKGFETEMALDGFTAGLKLTQFQPDVMILDLKMKGMDGIGVLKNLSRELRTSLKILVVSGDTSSRIQEALRAGAHAALAKPFRSNELFDKIGELLGMEVSYAEKKDPHR